MDNECENEGPRDWNEIVEMLKDTTTLGSDTARHFLSRYMSLHTCELCYRFTQYVYMKNHTDYSENDVCPLFPEPSKEPWDDEFCVRRTHKCAGGAFKIVANYVYMLSEPATRFEALQAAEFIADILNNTIEPMKEEGQ